MAKRKRKSAAPQETESPSGQKRARQSSDGHGHGHGNGAPFSSQSISYGRVDPTYGQRSAIPGLDGDDEYDGGEGGEGGSGSDVECSVDVEALRYLRSVREEASGIPTLLVAPRGAATHNGREGDEDGEGGYEGVDRGIYENGVGDSRGWYEDGAYTAAPSSPLSSSYAASDDEHGGGRDAQEVYYRALLRRFEALRQQLAQVPPRHAVERLGADHGCYMSVSAKDHKMWRWRLRHTEPRPAQLARMDKDTVLRLLRMLGDRKGGYLGVDTLAGDEGGEARRRASAWVWGLLARLPGRGELISEEVGVVRELGKRAVWVSVEMKGLDMGGLEDQMGEGGEDEEDLGDEEVVDVEVDGGDEELDPESDGAEFTNGLDIHIRNQQHDTFSQDPRNSSSSPGPPIIGPISPESLRGQSSLNLKSISKAGISETPTLEAQANEDETLATARARLLARLGPPTEQPQPVITDDTSIETLLEESQKILSLPQPRAHEAKEYAATIQKQLDKLVSAMPQQTDEALRERLELKAARMQLLRDLHRADMEHAEGFGFGKGNVATAAEDGERVGEESDEARADAGGDGSGEVTEKEAKAERVQEGNEEEEEEEGEEEEEDRHSAMQGAKVLLDMIITIAGEVYGQRDLLEFREVWG